MDLTRALLRLAARTSHVLIVPVPGAARLRMDVEDAVGSRRWREASGPADTDLLIVAGTPGPEMRTVLARVWELVPAPRVRIDLDTQASPGDIGRYLDEVPGRLADPLRARDEARTAARRQAADDVHGHRPGGPARGGAPAAAAVRNRLDEERQLLGGDGGPDHEEPARDGEHEGHGGHAEHGGREGHAGHGKTGGHGGHHSHHHMDMPLPGGLGMADVAEDRDGLALDVLNLPLGPVLPDWPAGLVLDVVMQGDVIASAEARFLDGARVPRGAGEFGPVVGDLDVTARVLAVAGWPGPAARARALRDRVRRGAVREEVENELTALVRRVRGSRTLRLMLRGPGGDRKADVAGLLDSRLSRIEAHAAGRPTGEPDEPGRPSVRELGGRLAGAEWAAARLLIAALDPHPGPTARHASAGPGPAE
ncbi:hypothetical protein AB0B51_32730 [Streptomyces griseus]|uniref:hypothetical protein n=1 Tax=Streptomyces griseus TaxID=1911 RepID=UPI0004CC6D8A|nr:hypothetical protein [Streptomyces griseus]